MKNLSKNQLLALMPGLKKGENLQQKSNKRKKKTGLARSTAIQSSRGAANRGDYGGQLTNVVQKGLGATLRMYPETINFAEVYTDPFSIKEARLPFLPIYSTKVVRSIVRANGAIGTNGFGFVQCVPMWGATTDVPSVYFSGSSFTGVATALAGTGVLNTTATKIGYTSSSYDVSNINSFAVRCVSYGVRVKYTGTELNSAGEWFAAQSNPRVSLNGFSSDALRKVQGHKSSTFADREWHVYTRMITSRMDAEYMQLNGGVWNPTCFPGTITYELNPYMAVIIQGTAGGTFDIEVAGHYEVIGPNLDVEKVGRCDEFNAQSIVSTGMKLRHKDNTTVDHTSPKKNESTDVKLMNFLKEGAKRLIPIVGDLTGTTNIISAIRDIMN